MAGKVRERYRNRRGRVDDLDWLSIACFERGAQRFVARHQPCKTSLERLRVQVAPHAHGERNIVGRSAGVELLEDEQRLLSERKRQRAGAP